MANKRMFSLSVIDTDFFLDMPVTSQALYFHLGMRADDDGFIDNPKKIIRMIGFNEGDMRVLFDKEFIIPFDSGVCVIRHWRINNYLRSDRYHSSIYTAEKSQLHVEENGVYTHGIPLGIPDDKKLSTQSRLEEVRIDKVIYGECENVKLTHSEYKKCIDKHGKETTLEGIDKLSNYKASNGKKYKSDYGALNTWVWKSLKESSKKENLNNNSGIFVDNSSPIKESVRKDYKELYGE